MKTRTRQIRFASGVDAEATLAAVRAYSENACTAPRRIVLKPLRKPLATSRHA
jgi:hypothetical protein